MNEYLTKLNKIIGKTVKSINVYDPSTNDCTLLFTDGTEISFEVRGDDMSYISIED